MIAGEPLKFAEAKERIRNILSGAGSVTPSQHALDQLHARDMTMVDVVNVLRGGYVESAEEIAGTWRYRVCTPRMVVIVAFRAETELRLVTGWRIRR